MNHKVGQKGQIVIEKRIRDKLGVKPGWQALQLLVGDHVEVYFVPPEHNRSLGGRLAGYAKPELDSEEALRVARARGWAEAAREQEEFQQDGETL